MAIRDLAELVVGITTVEVWSLEKEKTVFIGYPDDLLHENIADYEVESIEVSFGDEPNLVISII